MDPRAQFAERLRALKDAAAISVRDLEIASARTPRRGAGQPPLRLKRSTIAGMTSRSRPVCPQRENFEVFVDTCLRVAASTGRSVPEELASRTKWDAAYHELVLGLSGDQRQPGVRAVRQVTAPARTSPLAEAKEVLAGLVEQQWRTEAALRSLDDPDPIPVRWRATGDQRLVDHPENRGPSGQPLRASSGDIAGLTARFRAMRRRRLVILGGPGTGKTTLAVQLLLDLLASRRDHPDEPVPVLVSAAGWDPAAFPLLQDWLAVRLAKDYPALDADSAAALAGRGQILPVLDGLDELPAPAQAAVIVALNRCLGGADQLVVTARTADYAVAVESAADVLTSAQVIEPQPLAPADATAYLRRCLPPSSAHAWEEVLAAPGALADVIATPLGLWLLRTVYLAPSAADPASLLDPVRFPDAAALRAHLFDGLIPALIESRPPSARPNDPFRPRRRHDPEQLRRWLGHLARSGTRDLAWWQLAGTISTGTAAVIGGAVALAIILTSVCSMFYAVGPAAAFPGGLGYGTGFGLAAGLVTAVSARSWARQPPGFADLRLRRRRPWSRPRLVTALERALAIGLAAGAVMAVAMTLNVGFVPALLAGTVSGAAVTVAFGLAAVFTAWAEAPTPEGQASTPMASWRADRALNLTRAATTGLASALTGGVAAGLAATASETPAFGLAVGLSYAVTFGLTAALAAGHHHAWMAYVIATTRFALNGTLPRGLMPVLDDAHRLGLLRAVGPIYQFRHAELQDHLGQDV
ncbi:NACHT domain-containing protein [Nonomuraea sp. NPDC050556]|uniref:NACHT domain-containing protein n=1 Tax=Nonomuraea sp. NPDC050556 TaxID=3364369 RepID=UPI00379A75A6